MAQVVFIGGAMRSGTTLLGTLLGAKTTVFNAGEISLLWRGVADGHPCSCGAALTSCPVWGPALRAPGAATVSRKSAADLARLSTEHFRIRQLASLGRTSPEQAGAGDAGLAYLVHATSAVLDPVMVQPGSTALVDTSKRVSWLHFHRMANPASRRGLVHLVRDPRGVVASSTRRDTSERWSRDPGAPAATRTATATSDWLVSNVTTSLGGRGASERCVVLYEDLVRDPGLTLELVSRHLGVPVVDRDTLNQAMPQYETHLVAGNPRRFERLPLQLEPDNRWRDELTLGQRYAATVVGGPLSVALRRRARIDARRALGGTAG